MLERLERSAGDVWREPSAPFRIGGVEVRAYCSRRMLLTCAYGLPEARALVDAIAGRERLKWIDARTACVGQVTIESDELEAIVEYDGDVPTLACPHDRYVDALLGRVAEVRVSAERVVRTRVRGAISLATICAEMNIEGRVARAALRRAKVARPYAWDDVTEVRAILEKIR